MWKKEEKRTKSKEGMHKRDKMVVKRIIKITAMLTADYSITVRSDSYIKANEMNIHNQIPS